MAKQAQTAAPETNEAEEPKIEFVAEVMDEEKIQFRARKSRAGGSIYQPIADAALKLKPGTNLVLEVPESKVEKPGHVKWMGTLASQVRRLAAEQLEKRGKALSFRLTQDNKVAIGLVKPTTK